MPLSRARGKIAPNTRQKNTHFYRGENHADAHWNSSPQLEIEFLRGEFPLQVWRSFLEGPVYPSLKEILDVGTEMSELNPPNIY